MANAPRPGLIQLDHPNIYMAAKEAQKDDWLRRGINLTGDISSQALTERNRDIRYQRAAGDPEGYRRRTNGEVAGALGKGAWGGIKAIGSGIASVGEGAWGLLKAPFADEPEPTAPSSMEEYRSEVGEKKAAPIAETPDDILESPDQVMNAPKETGEVDGLPSTNRAEPNLKVTFPTTVAGFVEHTSLPETVVAKAEKPAQAPAKQSEEEELPEGMLRAPNWSEMFRLDPKRAEYDWGRERDLMTNETRQKTAGRNMQAQKAANAEHDIPIRQEMEEKAIALFEDVRSGALDKNSSEYVSRRGELGLLNAKLYSPYNKTSFDKLLSEGVVDEKLALREEGMDIDREKEKQRILENTSKFAESAGKQIMSGYSDLLKKIETRGSMLESFRQGTLSAIASKSSATFAAALKSLIQSLDNSVVMQGEWGPFQNASYLDRAKAWLEKQSNNTTFSGEEMRQAWETAKAWAASTKTIVAQAQDTAVDQAVNYPGLRRQNIDPKEVSSYVYAALEAYVPKSDFSKEPDWPAVLDMTSPTLQEGAGVVDDLLADPKGDAGLPVDPMAVVPKKKKKKQSAPAVPMATEDDLW